MLDLRRLRLLRELHSRGTIADVAAALSFSPSTVSQQLTELQREAGVRLFERSGRRLRLTGAAHILVRHAETMLAQMERAEAEMAEAAGTVAGVVRVAAFQTAAMHLMAPAMRALAVRYPALRIEAETAEPERALSAVLAQEVDLVLYSEYGPVPRPLPRSLHFEELHVEPVRILLSRDHPPARHPVRLTDLAREPWAAGPPDSSHGRMIDQACEVLGGFTPDVRHRTTDMLVLRALVGAGQAVTLQPALAWPHADDQAVTVHEPAEGAISRRILTAVRGNAMASPALTAVRDALRASAAGLTRVHE